MGKSPSYLVLQGQIYYSRMSIPLGLRKTFGKTEIRYSLRTGYLREARARSRVLAVRVHKLMNLVHKGAGPMSELTAEQIKELADTWMKEGLEEDELDRALAPRPMTVEE